MKRIFITAIACLLVLTSLWSCAPAADGNTPDDSTPQGAITTPVETTPAPQPELNLALASQSAVYSVIRAEDCDQDITDIAVDLRTALNEMTSFSIKIETDWVKRGTEPDPEKLEILVSNTNRPESDEVLASIGYFDYAIKVVGKKVVIAGHTTETIKAAIDYFLTNLLKTESDGSLILTGEYTYKSGVADIISSPEQLAEYILVFPVSDSNAREYAQLISSKINMMFNVRIDYVSDRASAVEKEILIGKTNRPESESALKGLAMLDYKLCVVGSKIIIGGNSTSANSIASEAFIKTFASGKYSDTLKIPSTLDLSQAGKVVLDGGEDPTLAEGADLRIMSFNILAEKWDEKAKQTMPGREKHVAAILMSYMPDVVGLQETTDLWYSLLGPAVEGIYKFASYTTPGGKTNYSTLMYNINTTEFIEGGTTVFTIKNSENMRNLTWGRFRRISDGKEYIVTCTHWDITDEKRQAQWPENAQIINSLYSKYNLPIFSTGDYNSNEQDLFAKFLEATKMIDPRYEAKVSNNAGKTTHTLGSKSTASGLCIDHIACTPGSELLYYIVLRCQTALDASDHCPVYIDVKLK